MHKIIVNDLLSVPSALRYLLFIGLLALGVACSIPHGGSKNLRTVSHLYTFGDAGYEKQLSEGRHPIKQGPIAADEIPEGFPKKFLEPDGSYAGGRVFRSVAAAQQAVIEARNQGIISQEGEWGIYQLNGNWNEDAYELKPNDYRLKRTTTVLRRAR